MGLVIALATLGLIYGNWTQTLTIGGNVDTSSLDAQFKAFVFTDSDGDSGGPKDVGECGLADPNADLTKNVVINFTNVYPNYTCTITGGVMNTGQMPIHVEDFTLVVKGDNDGLAEYLKIDANCDGDLQVLPQENLQCTYIISVNKVGAITGGTVVPQKANVSLNFEWQIVQFDKATP